MKKLSFSLILLFLISAQNLVWSSLELISEVESLRDSLSLTDRQRPRLTLRLADLYFDLALDKIQKDAEMGFLEISEENKDVLNTSLNFYEDSINGENGKFPAPSAVATFKIYFQKARIFQKLKKSEQSISFFEKVVSSEIDNKNIKRESALNLAEIYEESNRFEKAKASYDMALNLCDNKELCSYVNYRKSWIFFKEGNLEEAINTIKLGLYDSAGNLKDQALKDYLMFVVQRPTEGNKELVEMEAFSLKHKRPEIMNILMDGFFGEGNRVAGVNFLVYLNKKNPTLANNIRLMEEYYGFRDWKNFRIYSKKSKVLKDTVSLNKEESEKANKILKRLIVQLDSERKNNDERSSDLQNSIDLYLTLYPNDELRDKMVNGWIAAEKDENKILMKLAEWIAGENKFQRTAREKELRIKRISLAQKLKNYEIIKFEAHAVLSLLEDDKKKEYEYLVARTLYEEKKYEQALPLFQKLAALENENSKIDKWSLQSQNLALDILSQMKRFTELKQQAMAWTGKEAFKNHKEYKEMATIFDQAKFEEAIAMKETPEALRVFMDYCLNDKYSEKSCSNAKVLAFKLKDQQALIEVLKKLKDDESLIAEYEAMGEFEKAAYLIEKKTKKFDLQTYLKLALFYEIAQNIEQRDRLLRKVITNIKKMKNLDENQQSLLYLTFNDANMIDSNILSLPWSTARKMQIIHEIELRGIGNKKTYKELMSSKTSLGDKWSLGVLAKVESLYETQKKRDFYGKGSQWKFKKRISLLKSLADYSKEVLEGADLKTRVVILGFLTSAYQELHAEILATPLPEGLTEEQLQQVSVSLQDMAAPFKLEEEAYRSARNEQIAALQDEALKAQLAEISYEYKNLYNSKPSFGNDIAKVNYEDAVPSFDHLKAQPNNQMALENLRSFFEKNEQIRISNYFKGRIQTL